MSLSRKKNDKVIEEFKQKEKKKRGELVHDRGEYILNRRKI